MRKNTYRGFTLVELLVVIAIISLLSSVVLASLNSARERARATKIIQDVQQIEKALVFMADDYSIATWWTETQVPGNNSHVGNPRISTLVSGGPLATYLSTAPTPPVGSDPYKYDWDGDTFVNCNSGTLARGLSIYFLLSASSTFSIIDQMLDGGDGAYCGRALYRSDGMFFYLVSKDGTFY